MMTQTPEDAAAEQARITRRLEQDRATNRRESREEADINHGPTGTPPLRDITRLPS